ncbi:hypothetical protein [Achromobacter marplatensis]|uniref:hypothetical protein n=1 Tax=Achromobacter marplatensis TaxID=470868 RepID=UPI0039F6C52B
MGQSDDLFEISGENLTNLRKFLHADGGFCEAEVVRRMWRVFCIDDKSLFGEDARRLAVAFQIQDSSSFWVARVIDILAAKESVIVRRFEATQAGVEKFQGAEFVDINLDDCLLFNLPVTCVVFRPGTVDVTIFAGDAAFVGQMEN